MQNITAARLLPGFLGPAAGEWCAPLSLVQPWRLLFLLRFNAAQVNSCVDKAGQAAIGGSWPWAVRPIVRKGEGIDASQLAQLTREMTLENTVRASCTLAKKTRPIGKPCPSRAWTKLTATFAGIMYASTGISDGLLLILFESMPKNDGCVMSAVGVSVGK